MSENQTTNAPGRTQDSGPAIRWTVAVALVALATAAFLVARLNGDLEICQGVIAQTGEAAQTELCERPGLTEFAPLIFLALLVMLPDIAELSIAGVGSIKRRVEATEAKQSELASQIADLRITQIAAPTAAVYLDLGRESTRVLEELPTKAAPFGGNEAEIEQAFERAGQMGDADLRVALLGVWDTELWPWYETARRMRGPRWRGAVRAYVAGDLLPEKAEYQTLSSIVPRDLHADQLDALLEWALEFEDQLDVVRQGRNAVAHPRTAPALDVAALRRLVAIADELTRLRETRLSAG